MDRLYQNLIIFLHIFSKDNPNGICKSDSKTCGIVGLIFLWTVVILGSILLYFIFVGTGFLSSYILNHKSYNISSGCRLDNPSCAKSQLFCSGDNTYMYYAPYLVLFSYFCFSFVYSYYIG